MLMGEFDVEFVVVQVERARLTSLPTRCEERAFEEENESDSDKGPLMYSNETHPSFVESRVAMIIIILHFLLTLISIERQFN